MKKVINKNQNKLTFPKLDLSFEPDEIKKVSDEYFEILIRNVWIQEVYSEKEVHTEKKKKINKGRRNKK